MQTGSTVNAPALEGGRPITRLVLPTVDGKLHDRTTLLGALLAERWGVGIELVHVTASIASADGELIRLAEQLHGHHPSVEVRPVHLYGDDPAAAIADHVGPGSLVVMATNHLDRWPGGRSIAEAVLDRVGEPVLLVGPNVTAQHVRERGLDGEVVIGVDGSATAEAGVAPGVSFAETLGHGAWVVRIMPEPSPGDPPHAEVGQALQTLIDARDADADRGTPVRWEIVQCNDPVAGLEAMANRRNAAVITVSRRRHAAPDRGSIASMAGGLAALAQRPVLVLCAPEVPAVGAG